MNTCFCPVVLMAVIVRPSAVGVVDIDVGKCLFTLGIFAPLYCIPLVLAFELSLLASPRESASSSASSSDGERTVATLL